MLTFVKKTIMDNVFVYNLYRGINYLGSSTIGINVPNKMAHIYSINIGDLHRGKQYGSCLIQYIETDIVRLYDIKFINLLAYQKPIEKLEQFYIKNGYPEIDEVKQQYHDNGHHIYDIVPMVKNIKT